MSIHSILGSGRRSVAVAAALTVGLATAGAAAAAESPPSASVTGDTLTVIGSSEADHIALRLAAGEPNTLQVDFDDDGSSDQSFDRSTFSNIAVILGRGDDQFRVDQINGTFIDEALTVDGGSGDDTIAGGDGNEALLGGIGRDSIDGNRGSDSASLGAGDDSFTWDPGDGSDAVDGSDGIDALVFNGANLSEIMSLSASGDHTVFLRDIGTIRMDLDFVETLDLHALGGADEVTINDTTGTGFRQANLDLGSQGGGDGAADLVTVNGTAGDEKIKVDAHGAEVDVDGFAAETSITGSETTDQLQVNGQGGSDSLRVDDGVRALIGVAVDLT